MESHAQMMASYASNQDHNWRSMDAAIVLLTALAVRAETRVKGAQICDLAARFKKRVPRCRRCATLLRSRMIPTCAYPYCCAGVSAVNERVPLREFCVKCVLPELQNPDVNLRPILKVGSVAVNSCMCLRMSMYVH